MIDQTGMTRVEPAVRTCAGDASRSNKGDREKNRWFSFVRVHGEAVAAGISGLLILLAWLGSGHLIPDKALYLAAYIVGGFAKGREGILAWIHERKLDVNLLMLLAAAGAASIGYWMEGALLIFIFALSGA